MLFFRNQGLVQSQEGNPISLGPSEFLGMRDLSTEKRAIRKYDLAIIPTLTIFSFLSHLDRANLGNARAAGLQEDLKITDYQFSLALTVTFVPYVAAELPVNLLLKKIGANVMIPTLVTLWGIITTFQGFVRGFNSLLITRFLLGAVEGGLYPATILYVSSFYKRNELQKRVAIISSSAALSGAVAGILAYGLIQMDQKGHIPGWGWIFIFEGILTTFCGVIGFFLFPLSPSTCNFLTSEEKKIMVERFKEEKNTGSASVKDDHFDWQEVWCAMKSPHVLLVIFALFMTGSNLYGLAYFQPSIIRSLGYTGKTIQLVSVPPFFVGFLAMLVTSYASDHYQARGLVAALSGLVALLGYLLFFVTTSGHIRYLSLFLSTAGIYSSSPTLYAWLANNSSPHYRKATAIALGPIAANSGGILSTWLFPRSEEPNYNTATTINMIFSGGITTFSLINLAWLKYCNIRKMRKLDISKQEFHFQDNQELGSEKEATLKFPEEPHGDQDPRFIYSY